MVIVNEFCGETAERRLIILYDVVILNNIIIIQIAILLGIFCRLSVDLYTFPVQLSDAEFR
jgi:hypothetical protein